MKGEVKLNTPEKTAFKKSSLFRIIMHIIIVFEIYCGFLVF